MNQVVGFAVMIVLILGVAVAFDRKWMTKRWVVFLVAVIAMLALRTGGIPPAWFDGGREGFVVAGGLIVSAFLLKRGDARDFGLPLLLGLGLTLAALNVVELVRDAL